MIDHISIQVRDLEASARFYELLLATLGHAKLVERAATVGFGKHYPEFWLNHRPGTAPVAPDSGMHICLRAPNAAAVDAFYRMALASGGTSDGAPGLRPEYTKDYYAAFIRDPEGNRIEAVSFTASRN
jgi:catechol 2,3-dioxygenase-like lactoylglutathione lyase family enzyme